MSLRKIVFALLIAAMILPAVPAFAELQNVTIGGEIRIRGRYWMNFNAPDNRWALNVPADQLPGRPMGFGRGFGRDAGIWSRMNWDTRGADRKYVEQRTVLKVSADFTDNVKAVATIESYDIWGEDFRSDYITGNKGITPTDDDLEFIEAYIETRNMWDTPLSLRFGRQLLSFGKEFLVGAMFTGTRAQPFDAVRLTYDMDDYVIDAWWAKLEDNSPREQDGDVDFYGVYGTYKGIEALNMSAYYMLVRDPRSLPTFDGSFLWELMEDIFGVDDYDVTYLNTVGLRFFGKSGGWDYDLEGAYQFGNADAFGVRFRPAGNLYGDNDASFDSFAAELEVGYTFDAPMNPRVFLNAAWYDGEDNRDLTVGRWLGAMFNPWHKPESSISFNRLFSNHSAEALFDSDQLFSNFWRVRLGTSFKPTEKISTSFHVAYYGVVDTFDQPRFWIGDGSWLLGPRRPLFPALSFWTTPTSSDMGVITALRLKYQYTKDVYFALGWDHMFTGKGMTDGNFTHYMGWISTMGTNDKDADYVFVDTRIRF